METIDYLLLAGAFLTIPILALAGVVLLADMAIALHQLVKRHFRG